MLFGVIASVSRGEGDLGATQPPTQQEQQDFAAKLARLRGRAANLFPAGGRVADAINSLAGVEGLPGSVEITFDCPNTAPVNRVKITITTQHRHWDRALAEKFGIPRGSVGAYFWRFGDAVIANVQDGDIILREKRISANNIIMLDPNVTRPQEQNAPLGPIADETLLYHELLHGQLLINAMRNDEDWQENVCACNNPSLDPMDRDHSTIHGLEETFMQNLAGTDATVHVARPQPGEAQADGSFEKVIGTVENLIGDKEEWFAVPYFPSESNIDPQPVPQGGSFDVDIAGENVVVRGRLIDRTKPGYVLIHIDPPTTWSFTGIETGLVIDPPPACGETFPACNGACPPGFVCRPDTVAGGGGCFCQVEITGACCTSNGCVDDLTELECVKVFAGSYLGDGTVCISNPCTEGSRVSSTQKGSVLIFSKIEVKWDASGNVIQDTFLDITNDYPAEVAVQGYFINGDTEIEEVLDATGRILQPYEPGWNTADCRFELTGNQPHFWSAAQGSDKCQPFTVLDDDGPGRLDPEANDGSRVLRGYAIFWATKLRTFPVGGSAWGAIYWNHLKGDAVIVNYANGTAWEYNAWAFQAHSGAHGIVVDDGFSSVILDGNVYDAPYASLLLDFYASGSTVLSGGTQSVMVDTDLTLHAVSADLRQDGCGPVLTKVEADIWNEFESKFSGTRRCICCWDQTMLSDWVRSVAIPNHFTRSRLGTDKGKARLDGVASTECDYEELCGTTAKMKRWNNCLDTAAPTAAGLPDNGIIFDGSEDAAILGLATKFLAFSPSGEKDAAGMNLVGAGTEPAVIRFDQQGGPQEARSPKSASGRERLRQDGGKQ